MATSSVEQVREVAELARRLGVAERRIRSMLSEIGAMVRLTAKASGDNDQYAAHLEGRLGALARAQGVVLCRPEGTVELHDLVADELLAHAAIEDENFSMQGPDVRLGGRAMDLIWLVVHELVVNSVKFGALSARDGMISVMWDVEVNGMTRLSLRWTERCDPLAPSERRAGYGTEVIERRLARELGGSGSLEFTASGLSCRISVPVGDEIRVSKPA